MDADGRFGVGSDEFIELVGPRTMAAFGRLWSEIAAELKLDPDNAVARAVASHETWSGIVVSWPVDDSSERLPVELSGLPVFDRDRSFRGYRGFGVCRDIDRINELARARRERPIGFMAAPAAEPPPAETAAPASAAAPDKTPAAPAGRSGSAIGTARSRGRAGVGQCGAVSAIAAGRAEAGADFEPGRAPGVSRTGAGTDRAAAAPEQAATAETGARSAARPKPPSRSRSAGGRDAASSMCCSTAFPSAF